MEQVGLFPVNIVATVTPASVGIDGADLKWIAKGDDGHDYAMKTLADHPALPLTEWVCYRLWQACGLPVPECAALHQVGQPVAFGSRFELAARQLQRNADAFTIAGFFGPHLPAIGTIYPMDAFITNSDRHGRNLLVRAAVTGDRLVSIDFSRAAMVCGKPFGKQNLMHKPCSTLEWWHYFRDRMGAVANHKALQLAATLTGNWLSDTIAQAPPEWSAAIDLGAVTSFWQKRRAARVKFAKMWA